MTDKPPSAAGSPPHLPHAFPFGNPDLLRACPDRRLDDRRPGHRRLALHAAGLRREESCYTVNGHPRSGKWQTFERDLIKARAASAKPAAGARIYKATISKIFTAHPEKELDPDNVAILCGPKARACHGRIGHSFDFRAINPHCREDAARQRHRVKTRVYE